MKIKKKIGRQVLFLTPGENNPRNGEGTFLTLKDGSILYAYSRFTGNDWTDHSSADIAGIFSRDGGESWTEPVILLRHDEGSSNFMCPMLLRMQNGDAAIIYLRKYHDPNTNETLDNVYIVRSRDEGKSWSEPVAVTTKREYIVVENDHVLRLSSGRIIVPGNRVVKGDIHGRMFMTASDDDGRTWREISGEYESLFKEYNRVGLQETTVYEEEGGRLRALSRTDQLCQYECYSDDSGETWYDLHPNYFFTSPDAPLLIKKVGKYTVAIFNPIPAYTTRDTSMTWGRTPLVMAVSDDDGRNFSRIFALEDDPKNGYCYPSVLLYGDHMLVGYYHSNNSGFCLNSNKIIKIDLDELL